MGLMTSTFCEIFSNCWPMPESFFTVVLMARTVRRHPHPQFLQALASVTEESRQHLPLSCTPRIHRFGKPPSLGKRT
jgi:hypothetical protein